MSASIALTIQQAIVNGHEIPADLRPFAVNDEQDEVRLLSVMDANVKVYNGDAADTNKWDPRVILALRADAPVQIAGRHGDAAVKLFFGEHAQLFTADLGCTFIYDGSTLVKAYPVPTA
jgi:hypothetical protein